MYYMQKKKTKTFSFYVALNPIKPIYEGSLSKL